MADAGNEGDCGLKGLTALDLSDTEITDKGLQDLVG